MKTEFREENQNYVMTFEGRLDTPSSLQVERDMQVLYDCEGHDIILDCTNLEYITSSGMRLFLDLLKVAKSKGSKCTLVGLNNEIYGVFDEPNAMTEEEIKEMQAEIERLRADNARLQSEMIRLVSRNLNLSEQLEVDVELHRRFEVARTLMKENIERQRNADLQDDGQLLALIDLRLEEKRSHLDPDFDSKQLAELIGVSQERLNKLFRNKSIYRTPEAYIDNLRTINAMRLLRTQPNYSIAAISEASGFNHVRTLQRRIMDVTGMTPADYRALFTRDM